MAFPEQRVYLVPIKVGLLQRRLFFEGPVGSAPLIDQALQSVKPRVERGEDLRQVVDALVETLKPALVQVAH
jgi:hypothetical protein